LPLDDGLRPLGEKGGHFRSKLAYTFGRRRNFLFRIRGVGGWLKGDVEEEQGAMDTLDVVFDQDGVRKLQ